MAELPPKSSVDILDIPTGPAYLAASNFEGVADHSIDAEQANERADDENNESIGDVIVEASDDGDSHDQEAASNDTSHEDQPNETAERPTDEPQGGGDGGKDGGNDEPPHHESFDSSDHDDEKSTGAQPEDVNEQTPEDADEGAKILFGNWPGQETVDTSEPPYEEWMFEIPIKGIDPDDRDPDPNREHNVLEGRWPKLESIETESADDAEPPLSVERQPEFTNEADDTHSPEERESGIYDESNSRLDEVTEDQTDEPESAGGGSGDGNGKDGHDGGNDEPPEDYNADQPEPDDENPEEKTEKQAGKDEDDKPLTPEDVYRALAKILASNPDRQNLELTIDSMLVQIDQRGLQTAEPEDEDAFEGEFIDDESEADDRFEPDEQDDIVDADEIDETGEEPELTPEEAERQGIWAALEYRGLLDSRSEADYPPDSIAARKLKLDTIEFEQRRLALDSVMHPENKPSNDAQLERLTDEMAQAGAATRAKRTFAARFADEKYMRFTPEQLTHLREVAVEELSTIDPRAAGSSSRWDELLVNLDSIDRTLNKWGEVMMSENALKRALQVGRRALENSLVRDASRRDIRTEDLLSETEATLRGMSARLRPEAGAILGDVRRRVAGRRAARSAIQGATSGYIPGVRDRAVAGSLRRRARNAKLEMDLQAIEKARRQQVPGRRQAVKDAMKAADEEMAEAPTGQIRGKGNALKGGKLPVREFGKSSRKTSSRALGGRPPMGSPERKQARHQHKEAVRNLHEAQARVRKARAQLNQHEAADRVVANIPMLGTILAPKTVVAQVALQEAIYARDAAARSPHLRLPASIGRYVG